MVSTYDKRFFGLNEIWLPVCDCLNDCQEFSFVDVSFIL
jgi:hypothetical protein